MTHQQQLRLDLENDFAGYGTILNAKPFVEDNALKNKSIHTTTVSKITTRAIEPTKRTKLDIRRVLESARLDERVNAVSADNTSSLNKVIHRLKKDIFKF